MAKKRVKSNLKLVEIHSWQHVDETLRSIGELQDAIGLSESNTKAKINAVKQALADDVKARMELIDMYTKSLEAFAVNHKEDFGKKRSKAGNFGIVGWRKSSSISVTKNTLGLIKKVFKSKIKQLIRITESVDKDALAKLMDEQLAAVGAKRKVTDDFFAEPSEVKAADVTG